MALAARQGRGGFCQGRRKAPRRGRSAAESLDRFRPPLPKSRLKRGHVTKERNLGPIPNRGGCSGSGVAGQKERLLRKGVQRSGKVLRVTRHLSSRPATRIGWGPAMARLNERIGLKASGQHEEQASVSTVRGVGAPSRAERACGVQHTFSNLVWSECIALSSLRTASVSFRMRTAPACFGTTIL